jgi:Bacterial Ig-like domain (group 3)
MRSPVRLPGFVAKVLAVFALILGSVGIAAVPAHAASMSLSGPSSGIPGSVATYTVTGGSAGNIILEGTNGSQYGGSQEWVLGTPSVAFSFSLPSSSVSLYARNTDTGDVSNTINVSIGSTVATVTYISAPNVATVGVATKVTVNVVAQGQTSYAPTGTVTVVDGAGNVVTTMGLTPDGSAKAYAYWWWTPPTPGTYSFTARYNGDSIATSSTSATDQVSASTSGNTISLLVPAQLTVGVPATLIATLVPSTIQGSVGFTFNGQPISASIPIKNGTASMQWTPTVVGAGTLGASFTTNGGASGSTTDKVTIVAGPAQQDIITLTQPGWGTWAPNGQYNLPNGTSTTMTATTLSGSQVVLSETGPCSVSKLTITVPVGSGQCNIKATSPGGKGYAAVTYGYTVNAIPGTQTASLAAPNSGNVTKGRTYVIEEAGKGLTNAGQAIKWSITKGKDSVCKLSYPSDGSVKLKMVNKGACNIKGTAPAIPNEWNAYSVTRNYTVK